MACTGWDQSPSWELAVRWGSYLGPCETQLGRNESLWDTARVPGRMFDGIEYRGFDQEAVEILAAESGVPVWNGLTGAWHPTQMLADILYQAHPDLPVSDGTGP
jgi:ornithine carbamoyltransferase